MFAITGLDGRSSSWVTLTDKLEFLQAGTHKMEYMDKDLNLCYYDHVLYNQTVCWL